jgi:hypothetical protein
VTDTRNCEQCGTSFVPRREHARFCAVACRVAWNRENMGDPAAEASALQWSITAMSETTQRLPAVQMWDRTRAFAAIGEAVWWVTMVDATLVRHHPAAYDAVVADQPPAGRQLVEETLTGLRFVRNQMGHEADLAELVEPAVPVPGAGGGRITGWTWKPVPCPALGSLSPRARAWEMTRYQAYQAQLAVHTVGEIFGRAAAFLTRAAANATSITDAGAHAAARQAAPVMPAPGK